MKHYAKREQSFILSPQLGEWRKKEQQMDFLLLFKCSFLPSVSFFCSTRSVSGKNSTS
jgi:hypothetical protein